MPALSDLHIGQPGAPQISGRGDLDRPPASRAARIDAAEERRPIIRPDDCRPAGALPRGDIDRRRIVDERG
ncbi:hypothetical protein BMJ34_12065 [Sinorhizobium medicae]|uniref:Uncharacterized protein n=1 Tax=Sinorhizobium medicae TaxID=110321 RepID=A0ABX4TP67_9HYPH|nr:hypothetical protein [Sinorhizobium medicae]PLT82691.1 hypothetical protein BMJ35_28180 [Sinorhizobium medicae]PLU01782.1 hypothetical protein BMJ34_12065 [Sinorhizobium medicae]PLU03955.1 hypothetical protein BMJ33_13790 [Sinorhizobium medicae]PLU16380.1 hypothetical protein BMJ29_23135 [Sinorhizobium medicae]PLU40831.1 hypothetical protein BMJ27_00200 [Sinorhizobium medicae]